MKITDLEKIKGSFYVYSNGEYVILPGTKLYILKTDGSLVTCRSDLRHAGRITFLSGSRMLLYSKDGFHMIDLCDGSDIWTAPYTKFELNVAELAVSPDEAFAYTYDQWNSRHFISQLDLQTHDVHIHDMYMDIGATWEIMCDEEGIPCLLKTLNETIGGKAFCQNGVRIHDFYGTSPGSTNQWKTKWSFDFPRSAVNFFDRIDRVITNDLQVYEPSTGISFDLLENETSWKRPARSPVSCWLDLSKRYLCVMYETSNVVIDIHARKVAALYAADFKQGCLIGSEYWICVSNRICRKPFPAFETPPAPNAVGGMEWYFSRHPERW